MGDGFRERLKRLRREAPPAPKEQLPPWLRRKLAGGGAPTNGAAPGLERSAGDPGNLERRDGPAGPWWLREVRLDGHARHGHARLSDALGAPREAFGLLTSGRTSSEFDLQRALYFDIETTGLSGGAGTHTYLVGLGAFEDGHFRVIQAFLPGPEAEFERALLAACAEHIERASGLVSFFGKSFDRHRLEDKMRQHGVRPPFDGKPHLDLYWPCRKLYGAVTADTRLATMERILCGVERANDLPGSFAPAAWFDYLSGRGHLLEHVFQHNLDDVLSLVVLLEHVGRSLHEEGADGRPWEPRDERLATARARAWVRVLAGARRWEDALVWAERAEQRATEELDGTEQRATALDRALLLVRLERAGEARGVFEVLVASRHDALAARAAVELACLHWKLEGDPTATRERIEHARSELERWLTGAARGRLEARLDVLERRCSRGG